jgi:hypothetical protein
MAATIPVESEPLVSVNVPVTPSQRDCSAIAVAILLNISYEEADHWFSPRWNRSKPHDKLLTAFGEGVEAFGKRIVRCLWSPVKIRDFVRLFPKGRFITKVQRHTFVVINGSVIDFHNPDLPGMRISEAWQVVDLTSATR